MLNYFNDILMTIFGYLKADWYILLIGILLAVVINVYVDAGRMKKFFDRKAGLSIPGAVAIGALTPLCACGTMAVLLSMFVSSMPWGTVMAFLISSPLTSPSEFMFEAAFFGSKFAVSLLISSVVLGLAAGITAHLLSKKTSFFKGQFRLGKQENKGCGCSEAGEAAAECNCDKENKITNECACGEAYTACCSEVNIIKRYKVDRFIKEFWNLGVKKILIYFIVFIAIGRTAELLIPKELVMTLFGSSKAYSVPLAATIGLPLYLTDSSAIPLLKSFINSGAGEGAVLAFLIAGKATGVPVIAGMATFLKKRAMIFYIGFVYFGAILAGYLYQAMSVIKL